MTMQPSSAPHPTGATIDLKQITKRYGGTDAVRDLSLRIEAGEFVSFLGPSGSGKTTTLMMIAGFVSPDDGHIMLGTTDITHVPPHRRDIGMVYQNYALFPHMTVAKNVAFPLRMRRHPRAKIVDRVAHALELVRLRGLGERLPGQLSGGQQQRVALARALVFEPPLVLMDEPLGALDKKLREEMQVEIRRIQRNAGSTAIYVTHDQEEALNMSDRIVVMNHGRIEQVGSPSEIYDRPFTRFVADFMGVGNLIAATVIGSAGECRVRSVGGSEFAATSSQPLTAAQQVTVALRAERITLQAGPPAGDSGHAGRLVSSVYQGSQRRHHVELATGETLIVTAPSRGAAAIGVGEAVTLNWLAEDAWVITA